MKRNDLPVCEVPHKFGDYKEVLKSMPDDDSIIEETVIFQQLSDFTRLKLLYILTHSEVCVYDLAEAVSMSAPAISHHLRSLRQLGIITYRRAGKHVHYSLADNNAARKIRHILEYAFERRVGNEKD